MSPILPDVPAPLLELMFLAIVFLLVILLIVFFPVGQGGVLFFLPRFGLLRRGALTQRTLRLPARAGSDMRHIRRGVLVVREEQHRLQRGVGRHNF